MELRRVARDTTPVDATCRVEDREFRVRLADLSALGCFVATEEPVELAAVVELFLQPPGHAAPTRIAGHVVRVSGPKDDHLGFAVEFVGRLEDPSAV